MNVIIPILVILAFSATQITAHNDGEFTRMMEQIKLATQKANHFFPGGKIMLDNVKIEQTDEVERLVNDAKKNIVKIVSAAKTAGDKDFSQCSKLGEKESTDASISTQKEIQKCYVTQLRSLQTIVAEILGNDRLLVKMMDNTEGDLTKLPEVQSKIIKYSEAVDGLKTTDVVRAQNGIINCSEGHLETLSESLGKVIEQVTACLKL